MNLLEIGAAQLSDSLQLARDFAFLALVGGALTLSLMLGAGGAAAIARLRVDDAARRRVAGAALILWLIASAIVLTASALLLPGLIYATAAGCALAFFRLAMSLKFHLRFALPKGADFLELMRAGFRPMIASVLFLTAALQGESLTGAILYALILLLANVALIRDEAGGKRAAGYLTALALLTAVPLAFLPGWRHALAGLLIVWLAAISLTAGLGAILHLPSTFYEAYLPVRAWFIRRRSAR